MDSSCIVAILSGLEVCVWKSEKGSLLCQMGFFPFDEYAFTNSIWKCGSLALNRNLNAAIVGDSAGNTCTFAILSICPPESDKEHF